MIYPSIYLSRCPDKPCGCAGSGGELSIYCGSIKVRQISNMKKKYTINDTMHRNI